MWADSNDYNNSAFITEDLLNIFSFVCINFRCSALACPLEVSSSVPHWILLKFYGPLRKFVNLWSVQVIKTRMALEAVSLI